MSTRWPSQLDVRHCSQPLRTGETEAQSVPARKWLQWGPRLGPRSPVHPKDHLRQCSLPGACSCLNFQLFFRILAFRKLGSFSHQPPPPPPGWLFLSVSW